MTKCYTWRICAGTYTIVLLNRVMSNIGYGSGQDQDTTLLYPSRSEQTVSSYSDNPSLKRLVIEKRKIIKLKSSLIN